MELSGSNKAIVCRALLEDSGCLCARVIFDKLEAFFSYLNCFFKPLLSMCLKTSSYSKLTLIITQNIVIFWGRLTQLCCCFFLPSQSGTHMHP